MDPSLVSPERIYIEETEKGTLMNPNIEGIKRNNVGRLRKRVVGGEPR